MSDNENQNESENIEKIKNSTDNKKGIYMAIGSCIGVAVASGAGTWLGIDNIGICTGIGVAIGVGVGLALGNSIEKKNK